MSSADILHELSRPMPLGEDVVEAMAMAMWRHLRTELSWHPQRQDDPNFTFYHLPHPHRQLLRHLAAHQLAIVVGSVLEAPADKVGEIDTWLTSRRQASGDADAVMSLIASAIRPMVVR